MKIKISLLITLFVVVVFTACKDKDDDDPVTPTTVTAQQVLTDFANVVANANYIDLKAKCNTLNQACITLASTTTDANLSSAQVAWKAARQAWEQSEGFLIGPVADFNYDPATDSWPVNTVELDSLLQSSNPLELANVDSLQFTLKGYHPIEYVLYGVGGTRTAAALQARELKYLTSLSQSLYNTVSELVVHWDVTQPGNFNTQFVTAGAGSLRYSTRKDAFLELVNAMGHICDEVANGKMEDPLVAHDSELVESQYAHNATTDFLNNIISVENVYLCKYTSSGKSFSTLVQQNNLSLDNDIRSKINNAKSALSVINPNYGEAIFTQQSQILMAQNAINDLFNEMNLLTNWVQTNINE